MRSDQSRNLIKQKENEKENLSDKALDKEKLKIILDDFLRLYNNLSTENKKRLNDLFFTEITSYFKRDEEDGIIEINIRGDGKLEKKWSEVKNANCKPMVRTSGTFGSADRTRTCNPPVNSRMLHH